MNISVKVVGRVAGISFGREVGGLEGGAKERSGQMKDLIKQFE